MSKQADQRSPRGTGTLVSQVADKLREAILAGEFAVGRKLPSEAQLTTAYGVSRTVIREAIAALRSDGLVEPRQGAGVFVLEPPIQEAAPFQNLDYDRVSSVIEMLELRTAVEVEAAALAALRRSPQQEETIVLCHQKIQSLADQGQNTSEADFALHTAIAEATNNPRFAEFMRMIGQSVIPRAALQTDSAPHAPDYLNQLGAEHSAIIDAISNGDSEAAAAAMRLHLRGSQARYRSILRKAAVNI